MNSFLPPVIFQVQANATQAIASFKAVNSELAKMEALANKSGKALTGWQKATLIGTKALKVLAGSMTVLAGIGVKMAMDLEQSQVRLGKAMASVGVASEENRRQVAKVIESYKALGFSTNTTADAYTQLISITGDVSKSNRLLGMAADYARAKQVDLVTAARLLGRTQMGNLRVFQQFGIVLDENKPKPIALAEAMDKLQKKLGGQAQAYTKTFAGQLAILNGNISDLIEGIGVKLLPILNTFVQKLNGASKFLKDHSKAIEAIATAITVLLIPAIINLTKRMILLSAAMLKNPFVRVALGVYAIAVAMNKASGEANSFAKIFGGVADKVLAVVGFIFNGIENVLQLLMRFEQAGLKIRKAWASITGDKAGVAAADLELAQWEARYHEIDQVSDGIERQRDKIRAWQQEWKGFGSVLSNVFSIPGFDNSTLDGLSNGVNNLSDALVSAIQRVKDFNTEMVTSAEDIQNAWSGIVGRDVKKAIEDGLLNPVDALVAKMNSAVSDYKNASGAYATATSNLKSAQIAYVEAVKSGNNELIASTESALKRAEDYAKGLNKTMEDALGNVAKLQDDMISEIISSQQKINELQADRAKALQEEATQRLSAYKDYSAKVEELNKQHNKNIADAQAEAAKRTADVIKQSVDLLRGAFRSATYRGIGDIFSSLTFEGRYLKGGTIQALSEALGTQTAKAKALADKAGQLQALGFTQSFIEEVVAQGPDVGGALADTILAGTPESIAQLQAYWKALDELSSHGVDNIAKTLNSGITLATEELTQQLAQIKIDLNDQLASYQVELTDALASAYSDYSDALAAISARTKEQVSEIDSQITALNNKIAQLQAALLALKSLEAPATSTVSTLPYAPATSATYDPLTGLRVTPEDARALAIGELRKTSTTSMADYGAYRESERSSTNIVVNAVTNATAQQIADDVGWVIRTSSDVQYRSGVSAGKIRQLESLE